MFILEDTILMEKSKKQKEELERENNEEIRRKNPSSRWKSNLWRHHVDIICRELCCSTLKIIFVKFLSQIGGSSLMTSWFIKQWQLYLFNYNSDNSIYWLSSSDNFNYWISSSDNSVYWLSVPLRVRQRLGQGFVSMHLQRRLLRKSGVLSVQRNLCWR